MRLQGKNIGRGVIRVWLPWLHDVIDDVIVKQVLFKRCDWLLIFQGLAPVLRGGASP